MLRKIHIRGFRSIRDSGELALGNLNVLVGANGSGKSNFIEVFRYLHAVVAERLQLYVQQAGGADALFYGGVKTTPAMSVGVEIDDNGYEIAVQPTPHGVVIGEEKCWFYGNGHDDGPFNEHLGAGHTEALLAKRAGVPAFTATAIRSWVPYHLHDTSSTAAVKQSHDLADDTTLHGDVGNLAVFLWAMEQAHPDAYAAIVRAVQLVAPFFGDFVLEPDAHAPHRMSLRWRDKSTDTTRSAHQLSDGTLRFIGLTTALLQPSPPATMVIDEPELGLHPYAIVILAGLLRSASARRQLIVATQSVTLLNQLDPQDLIVLDRVEGATVFRRLRAEDYQDWIGENALGELWEKNIIGGRPR